MADAQPRKRKDKRRKKGRFKDDSITGETDPRSPPTVIPQKSTSVDDTNIHVYHDAHTGGGWCAKIVFFILLAIIGVLIGFILLEYRGSTDLDAPVQDSKYAEIFEGWIDDTPQLHDDEDEHPIDDHDDEHDDDHDDDGHDDEGGSDEHDDDEENGSEEGEQEEADEEEQTEASNEVEDEEGADDDEGDNEPEDEPQADEPDDEEQEDSTELANDEEGEENPDDDENNSEANDDNDDGDDLSAEDIQKVLDSLEEDDALEEVDEAADNSNENEVIDNNPEEAELLRQQEEAEAENEEESSSVAVKFGVGVALLVVAHLVLVRKWNNATNAQVSSDSSVTMTPPQTTDTSEGDLSRRNTIVSEDTVKSLHEAMERARIESQEMTDEEDLEDEEEEEEEEDEEEIEVKSYPKYGSSYQSEPEKLEVPGAKAPGAFDLSFNRPSPIRTSTPPGFFGDDEEAEEEKEEEEEEEEEVEEDDDEELLKKLEAKYGKLPSKQIEVSDNPEEEEEAEEDEEEEEEEEDEDEAFPSWRRVKSVPEKKPEPAEATPKASKTGGAKAFEDELLDEDQFFKEHASYDNNLERTVEKFRMEVRKNGTSTKALYGLAIALDRLAEKLRSNKLLVESIQAYENLLSYGKNIPDMLYKKVADRCINRMRFKGENARAITIHKALIEKFPTDVNFRNNLTITYLIIDKIEAARRNVLDTLKKWPNNGLAKTLYGFILKTSDNNIEKSVKYLKEGIESREPGVLDGRFFFHLGDALLRLGRSSEAMEVYETGVKEGFFLSKYQRSLYNVDRLTGRPWWTKEQTTYKKFFDLLEENWMNIRKEGLSLLNSKGLFKDEAENLIDVGDWKQFELFSRGRKVPKNCKQAPYTCSLVEFFTPASHCRRGQIKFSVMHPDTHVWPHCGPTNCRLRAHLGLKIPPKTFIRVAESTRTWTEGKIIIFDDSFEHEVWHNGTETRLILIVDVWHPELTANEKQTLPAI